MPPTDAPATRHDARKAELAGSLGPRIRARRVALGLSLEAMTARCGLRSDGHLSRIERGVVMPSSALVPAICRALRWTPDELFGWEEPANADD